MVVSEHGIQVEVQQGTEEVAALSALRRVWVMREPRPLPTLALDE